jgi:hypothetical protein
VAKVDTLGRCPARGRAATIGACPPPQLASSPRHLKVGHRYQVTISLGDKHVKRTVELQPNTKESAVKRQLGL